MAAGGDDEGDLLKTKKKKEKKKPKQMQVLSAETEGSNESSCSFRNPVCVQGQPDRTASSGIFFFFSNVQEHNVCQGCDGRQVYLS